MQDVQMCQVVYVAVNLKISCTRVSVRSMQCIIQRIIIFCQLQQVSLMCWGENFDKLPC